MDRPAIRTPVSEKGIFTGAGTSLPVFGNGTGTLKNQKRSEVIVLPEPVYLGRKIAVQDVALLVLKAPRDDDQDISLADPGPLLDLPLDPAHPFNAIGTADLDVVCPHHQLCAGELLAVLLLRQPDTDYRCAVRIEFCWCTGSFGVSPRINSNISVQ